VGGQDGDAHHRIQFRVLGPLQVLRDGNPVSIGGAQQRAVLAFLLAERERAVSVDQIADALWGERPPAGYAATIQTYIFHLREMLEPDRTKGDPPGVLVTEPGGYRLTIDPGEVDAADFEFLIESGESFVMRGLPAEGAADLRRALSLWRGSVLADLAGYDFVARLSSRLDELRLRAIESRIDAELALGHHTSLIVELNSLAQSHPLREHLQAKRILALYRAGRQADALEAFRSVRRRLMDELGIEPSAELTHLHQSILNQDGGLLVERPARVLQPNTKQPNGLVIPFLGRKVSKRLVAISVVSAVVLVAVTMFAVHHSRSSSLRSLPANSLVRIDSEGSFHDPVTVGVSPDGVALAVGAAWVANTGADTVSKIDLKKHVVVRETVVGSAPQALAVSDSDLWVVNSGAASVSRLNLKTSQVTGTVRVGNLPGAIAVDESGIWVVNTGDGTVVRINPTTDETDEPIAVGFLPDGIAVDGDTVWVSNSGDGTVSPIDAKSGVAGSSIAVGAGPSGIAVSDGAVWVANSLSQTVSRIDPTSRQVVATIRLGDGPHSVTVVRNRLWVSNEFDGTVTMIDPLSNLAVKQIATGASVPGLVSDGEYAYATTRSLVGAGHRGGTLHITTAHLPDESGIDPSNADNASVFSAFSLVYDGLVGLRRTGGAAGMTPVPDLALDLPRPSHGGLTYTFRLRRGIHYSNGAEVKPGDIRLGLQQELTVSDDPGRLANIVGAPACIRIRTVCDLSRGVVTNDKTFEITFNLRDLDPDFVFKLTEPLFATPAGDPGRRATTPRPATGPYMIGEYRSKTKFTLVRNPEFHRWSFAAQPSGYPDQIEWTVDPDVTHAVRNVLAGVADADQRAPAAADYATLLRTNSEHFHSNFAEATSFMFLNTRVAPFDNADVRKAINFAVDRNKIVDLVGGPSSAAPTCQIAPPNFPGYRQYCPYTANPTPDGRYHGPDFATASALVERSGTRGKPVTVVSYFKDPAAIATAKYVARVLTRLGYKAKFASYTNDNYFSTDNRAQIGTMLWLMDYPSAANFLSTLSCTSGFPGGYCNKPADNLFVRALDSQRTDPARANTEWATLDRTLTNDAAWLSLYNPRSTIVLSDRVGNYLSSPKNGPLWGQTWVVN
jgi:peptide/nickel transport system substrate-binding protein